MVACVGFFFSDDCGLMSFHWLTWLPLLVSASAKLATETASNQPTRPSVAETGEFWVKLRAEDRRNELINFDDCVMPAVIMLMIRMTIESSIKENAVCFLFIFILFIFGSF